MPPTWFAGDLGGGASAQFRVRPDGVVVVLPGVQQSAGLRQRREQGLVEAFVAQAAVEALDEGVVGRLARRDVMPFDLAFLKPAQDRCRGQLGAIVADHRQRLAARGKHGIQFARDAGTRQRCIRHQRQAFPREVVDHAQDAKAAAAGDQHRPFARASRRASRTRGLGRPWPRGSRAEHRVQGTVSAYREVFRAKPRSSAAKSS